MARRAPAEQPAATDRPAAERDGDLVVVSGRRPPLATARAFLRLTKPRVIELLLITTVPAMVLAAGAWPGPALVIAVLVGGTCAAAGANTVNSWLERDRDRLMRRTRHRPLPTHEVSPRAAIVFGVTLEVVAFVTLWWAANLLAASLALASALFYVFVYTIWLKPRTDQNIVIGGAAGAGPVLVGWAAVTGSLAAPAWVLFALVFVWTPAHFWALAIRYLDDYRSGGFPMLPVVRGVPKACDQILLYAGATVCTSLLLPLVADVSWIYLAAAAGLGGWFVWRSYRLRRDPTPQGAIRLFSASNAYLAGVFIAVAADVLVLGR